MSDSLFARSIRRLRRAVHRFLNPEHAAERAQLEKIARNVGNIARAQERQLEVVKSRLTRLDERVARLALDRDVRTLDGRVERLRDASARQYKVMSQALKRADWDEELRVDERRLVQRLARLAKTSRPVLVGPWSGEVGFELLYWIPFVTWALAEAEVDPARVVILSRGGPASWYAHLGGRYLDLLSRVTPDEFRARTEEIKKQRTLGAFDREMVRDAIATAQLSRPFLLHPGLMYRLFTPFWKQKATVRRVETYTQYRPITGPSIPELTTRLPREYVAVRFYFSPCFPDTPENRAFVASTVRTLSESTDVVVLNTAFTLDDHRDFSPGRSVRIHTIDDLMTPDRNLDVQTAVIAGAKAFVGTYGGYSYLAPLCGVPSLAFYSVRDAFFAHHLELAERVFRRIKAGSLVPIDVRDAELVRLALSANEPVRS